MAEREQQTEETLAAGGVVFRRTEAGPEIVVAEQLDWRTRDRGVRLPKGHVEPGESLEEAALREVREESGIEARILRALRPVQYAFAHPDGHTVRKRVQFYLMERVAGEPHAADGEMESVAWRPLPEALAALRFDTERSVVAEARDWLDSR